MTDNRSKGLADVISARAASRVTAGTVVAAGVISASATAEQDVELF